MDALMSLFASYDLATARSLLATGLRAALWLVIGLVLANSSQRLVLRMLATELDAQRGLIYSRAVYYLALGLTLTSVMRELGFDLSVLLGAAGIVTVAVGFASQTSASNFISGVFLIAENPFKIGDFVKIGATSGTVLSIDTLSVKLRTLDNLFIRIPNESVIKGEVCNYSRFEIRRIDVPVSVAYREDLKRVQRVLLDVVDRENRCLEEPKAAVVVTGFGESAVNMELRVWVQRVNVLDVRNLLYAAILTRFREENIEIPFPHRVMVEPAAPAPLTEEQVS